MAWSAVSWAYKDLISSAKLAQMVENLRVHDHVTTDQGAALFPAWTAFTPVWQVGGVGATLAADSTGHYLRLGKTVLVKFSIATTSALAAATWTLNLPFTPAVIRGRMIHLGRTDYTVNNASWTAADLVLQANGSNATAFIFAGSSSLHSSLTANGDQWLGSFAYELA